jgi:hypothetical protein
MRVLSGRRQILIAWRCWPVRVRALFVCKEVFYKQTIPQKYKQLPAKNRMEEALELFAIKDLSEDDIVRSFSKNLCPGDSIAPVIARTLLRCLDFAVERRAPC